MSTIGKLLKLTLGCEDSFGRVLAGSTDRGIRTIVKDAQAAKLAGKGSVFKNFVNIANSEVDTFTSMTKAIDDLHLDKSTLKSLKQSSGNMKTFWKNMQRVLTGEDAATVFKNASDATESLASKVTSSASKALVAEGAETVAKEGAEVVAKKGLKGVLGKLKGKGGTIGIILSLGLEIPAIVQAFKNGDGLQQIGRSALNLGGAAAGAAAGAAIGSIIPGAGTVIGGIIGGALGFIGSMFGADLSKKAGDAIFGKSIQDQKDEAAAAQAEQAEAAASQPASTSTSYVPNETEAIKTTGSSDVLYTYGFKPLLDKQA